MPAGAFFITQQKPLTQTSQHGNPFYLLTVCDSEDGEIQRMKIVLFKIFQTDATNM
jgi:hypothetical protein